MMEKEFGRIVRKLLDGQVICRITDEDAANWLGQSRNLGDVNGYLSRIGLRVDSPAAGEAFLLVSEDVNEFGRAALKEMHKKILADVRPVMDFIDFTRRAEGTDFVLQPGDVVELNQLARAIDGNEKMRADLMELSRNFGVGVRGDGTDRNRLTGVMRKLEGLGYLKLQNPDREIYQATGKVNVFREMVAFLIQHTPGAQEGIAEELEQGTML